MLHVAEGGESTYQDERADQHAREPGQRVATALSDRRNGRPRTVAEHREPDAEEQRSEQERSDLRGLNVDRGDAECGHGPEPGGTDRDRRDHDLQDREVTQQKLPDDDRVLRDPAFLQQKAERKAGDETQDQPSRLLERHGPPSRARSLRAKSVRAVAIAVTNARAMKIQLDIASWSTPVIPCPLVQPRARRAPSIITPPPTNASVMRSGTDSPNRSRQIGGTAG